jgi:hypothetical protein
MAQRMDTIDQPAVDRGPLGRWGRLRVVEPQPSDPVAAGATVRWPGDGPRSLSEPPDPGLVWVAGLPDERASAELTMRDLLSTWRSAERRLEGMAEGDGEWSRIREQVVALRFAYQRLFAQIRRGSPAR